MIDNETIIWNGVLYMDEFVEFLPKFPFKDFIYENNQAWLPLVCGWLVLK